MQNRTSYAVLAGLVAVIGCDSARPISGEPPRGGTYEVPTGDPTGGSGGGSGNVTVANCTACHGTPGFDNAGADPLVAAAPPRALLGDSTPAVGAHRAHLVNGPLSNAVECASCHLVPTTPPPHAAQRQGKVSFSRLATTAWSGAPVSPTWNGADDPTNLTCSSTYCHGNFRNGNLANAPSWTGGAADGSCGSCHGVPPGGTHAQDPVGGPPLDCGTCHTGYTRTTVNLALHVNGRLDATVLHPPGWKEPDQHGLGALAGGLDACAACHTGFGAPGANASSSCNACHATPSVYGPYATGTYPDHASWQTECTFCHGGRDDSTGAPPRNTDVISTDTTTPQPTTDATIGAHGSHVAATHGIAAPLDCTACHETRWTSATDPGHVDAAPAEVFFNDVGPSANPGSYARPDCSSTYCHGNFTGGAGSGPVQWTGTFGGPFTLTCTSCHGQPPGPTSATIHHPPNSACGSCHDYGAATHVNGTIEHTPATGCTQCHGDLTASGVASTDVRAAPASNASAVSAHGDAATATSARGIGAHAKHLTGTAWRATPIACDECHAVPSTGDTAHANGNAFVVFGTLARAAWAGQPAIDPMWNGAGGAATLTCSSTYCHGAFKNGANAAPTWAAPSAVACGSCHGVSATSGPGGTHPSIPVGQTCGSCHGGTYTNGSVDPALHMNGALDVANLTCSTCHGDAGRTPVASATVLDALGANLVRASPPADAGGGPAATGAHLAHVNQDDVAAPGPLSNALACASCHVVPGTVGHSNGAVGVTFGGLSVTGGATPAPYDLGTHTCASTYCHGSFPGGAGANAIAWTAAGKLGCGSCHGAPPGPTSDTVHHPPNPACTSCHGGYTATTVSVATHVNGTIEHAPATGCTQCHGDLTASGVANTDVRAAPGSNANAVSAHGDAATATSARGIGAHERHLTGTTWRAAPIACGECHAAVSDTTHANGDPAVVFGALATTAWSGPAVSPVWNGTTDLTCSSTYCHGNFPNGANAAPTWAAPSVVACGSCHLVSLTNGPGGTHPTLSVGQDCGSCHGGTYTSASVDSALHMNGALDGGGESGGGARCSGCHATIFQAMNGGVPHTTKHGLGAVAGTNDSPTDDSGVTWANPLSANAAAARSCVNMCHGDHPHDLSSPATATHENNAYADATSAATRANAAPNRIGVGGTGGSVNRMGTDFDGTQANGGLCASCHRNPVDATRPAVDATAFDASAHDFAANPVGGYTWSYTLHDGGLFARNCTKCHASNVEGTTPVVAAGSAKVAVHFSDNASLLSGTTNPAGTAAGFVCYNCHGAASPADGAQGDRSGKDIQSQIVHATAAGESGHPAHDDAVHDSAAEFANAAFGNALGVPAGPGQRHASCLDCHDPHQARSGTHVQGTNLAGPPLQGAWGARWTGTLAAWTDPTSANFTKATLVAGTDLEATLCFKCHSAYYGTLPTSPSSSPAFAETDQAKEFNPANMGFHPVLASASANPGATSNVINGWTRTSLMTCTDCHESSVTADPNGPHGSASTFILKGPNTQWNPTLTLASRAMPSGTFCANCHAADFANSRFPGHTRGNHETLPCMNCHAAIPHGGPRVGMLVNAIGTGGTNGNCAPTGGPIADWDTTAPYYAADATVDRLCIISYPIANTANWAPSNCGCDGSGH